MTLFKTLLFTVVVPGTVAVLIPYRILRASAGTEAGAPGAVRLVALLIGGIGVAVYLWCAFDFALAGRGTPAPIDPPRRLVIRGLYRWTRNPMYLGVGSILLAEALYFASKPLLVYAGFVLACFHVFVVAYEEPALARRFGASYDRYRASVPRWLIRVPPR